MFRWMGKMGATALGLFVSTACLVNEDKPCDAYQVPLKGNISGCVCEANSVVNADGSGCVPCGVNQVVKANKCECDTGFAATGANGECVKSELGASCSATMPCAGDFPYCAAAGYCTKSGCTSNADCTGAGYWCDKSGATSFCSQPPTGLNKSCTSSAECAGLAASRCVQGTCQVGGCATGPSCFSDYVCCDYTPVAASIGDVCVPPTSLMEGKCPGTGAAPVVKQ